MKVLVEMTDEQYEEYKNRQNESEYLKSKIEALSIDELLAINGYKYDKSHLYKGDSVAPSVMIKTYRKGSEILTRERQTYEDTSEIDERYVNFYVPERDEK